jgi:hypothetical protein
MKTFFRIFGLILIFSGGLVIFFHYTCPTEIQYKPISFEEDMQIALGKKASCEEEPNCKKVVIAVDTHGQARGTLKQFQASLDLNPMDSGCEHSPTGKPVELCPSGY